MSGIIKDAPKGFHLNENEKVVNGIERGLVRCQGHCPCHHKEECSEDDLICPCKQFREKGICVCGLYIKD